ncbi:MAG TPA: glycosyltransferase family 2 protein [Mycobacteriales bacterium]|nr:glycosyltransferase family 2 protein [Mycobacteriales bacterium]
MPAVTVVIPTRNRKELLSRAVDSVCAQTLADWELVVVDDASTDDTWEWISAHPDPRVTGHRQTRWAERSTARNQGLEMARAPYVLFLDDDDELRPEALGVLCAALDETPKAPVAVGTANYMDASGRRQPPSVARRCVHNPWREVLAGWVAVSGQMLMRRDILRSAGAFRVDMAMAEDQELWLRLVECGPAVFVPDVVLDHRPHSSPDKDELGIAVEREIRQAFSNRVPDRRRVQRAIDAHDRLRASGRVGQRDEFRRAAALYFAAVGRCPALLFSPIMGASLRRTAPIVVGEAILPSRLTLMVRERFRVARARGHRVCD